MIRFVRYLPLLAVMTAGQMSATTVGFDVADMGVNIFSQNVFRITYYVTGTPFLTNQEFDVRFDPAAYGELRNPTVPAGFNSLLLQPNNPPGTSGDFSAQALIDTTMQAVTFSIEATMLGGARPGAQTFNINQLDQAGRIVSTLESGVTAAVPEPATWSLTVLALLIGGARLAVRRRT